MNRRTFLYKAAAAAAATTLPAPLAAAAKAAGPGPDTEDWLKPWLPGAALQRMLDTELDYSEAHGVTEGWPAVVYGPRYVMDRKTGETWRDKDAAPIAGRLGEVLTEAGSDINSPDAVTVTFAPGEDTGLWVVGLHYDKARYSIRFVHCMADRAVFALEGEYQHHRVVWFSGAAVDRMLEQGTPRGPEEIP